MEAPGQQPEVTDFSVIDYVDGLRFMGVSAAEDESQRHPGVYFNALRVLELDPVDFYIGLKRADSIPRVTE